MRARAPVLPLALAAMGFIRFCVAGGGRFVVAVGCSVAVGRSVAVAGRESVGWVFLHHISRSNE